VCQPLAFLFTVKRRQADDSIRSLKEEREGGWGEGVLNTSVEEKLCYGEKRSFTSALVFGLVWFVCLFLLLEFCLRSNVSV